MQPEVGTPSAPAVDEVVPRVAVWGRRIVVLGVLTAVASPAITNRASFPLSTYPIYAHVRERNITINVATATTADGTTEPLGLHAISGTDDPLIAQSTLDRAVATGTADELCRLIAARANAGLLAVEIATEQHDLVDRVNGVESLQARAVVARCEVPR